MKKILIIILISIIIVSILSINFSRDNNTKSNKESQISITYEKSKKIKINNIQKGLVYSNKIKVKNNTNKDVYYSIKWLNVKNTLVNQNKFLYKIDTQNSDAFYITDSQVPVADYMLSEKVLIRKNLTHTYEVTIKYIDDPGKEKNSSFEGIIELVSNE